MFWKSVIKLYNNLETYLAPRTSKLVLKFLAAF